MNYLVKINKAYYFRLRVPLDMVKHFNRREIKRTLATSCFSSAKSLVKKYVAESERVFTLLRSGVLTDDIKKQIIEEYVHIHVQRYEDARNGELVAKNSEDQKELDDNMSLVNSSISDDYFHKMITEWQDKFIDFSKIHLARKHGVYFPNIDETVEAFFNKYDIVIEKYSKEYRKFCDEMLAARIRSDKIISEHLKGNYETEYDIELRNRKKYLTLQELVNLYEDDKSVKWTNASRFKSIHRQIIHILGNPKLNEITKNTAIKLREALKIYPKNVTENNMSTPWGL